MPKQYEAIRDRFMSKGMGEAEAKTRAAKIYNSKHPGRPVTRKHKSKKKSRRSFSEKESDRSSSFGKGFSS